MRKGFLIYEEMRKFLIYEENLIFFFFISKHVFLKAFYYLSFLFSQLFIHLPLKLWNIYNILSAYSTRIRKKISFPVPCISFSGKVEVRYVYQFIYKVVQNTVCLPYKVLTYVEYRAVSGVFRTIDPRPPPSLPLARVCPPPAPKAGGYTLAGRWGGGGSILRKTPDIGLGLLQYNPSTTYSDFSKYL